MLIISEEGTCAPISYELAIKLIGHFACIQGLVLMLITLLLIGSSVVGNCFFNQFITPAQNGPQLRFTLCLRGGGGGDFKSLHPSNLVIGVRPVLIICQ